MFCNWINGSLLFLMLISYDVVKPFKAIFVSFIIVLGSGIGLTSKVLVLLAGKGVSFS